MTLSVCSICQDEETIISYFLNCCKYLSDHLGNAFKEVVMVDGGSKDKTVEIVKSYQEKMNLQLIEYPFDSFGQQKNRALELVTGDYILGLDADMTITKNFVDVFKSGWFLNKVFVDFPILFTAHDAYHFYHKWNRGINMRLWKRGPKFRTFFHEKLEGQPPSGLPLCKDVVIFENSIRSSDEALINRGLRYQKFKKGMEDEGKGPGAPDRYLSAKKNAEYAPLPDSLKNLVIEGT